MDILWLLLVVFAVPTACLVICAIPVCIGLYRGYCNRREQRKRRRMLDDAFLHAVEVELIR